jgi:hypothetical protein
VSAGIWLGDLGDGVSLALALSDYMPEAPAFNDSPLTLPSPKGEGFGTLDFING